jgi:hypothetical protein
MHTQNSAQRGDCKEICVYGVECEQSRRRFFIFCVFNFRKRVLQWALFRVPASYHVNVCARCCVWKNADRLLYQIADAIVAIEND